MGKKPQRHTWPEAKKRCRLNQLDIEMAKRLGFGPDSLIRAIPSPQQQKWKMPVKHWVRVLYEERFGHVLGEKPLAVAPEKLEYDEEAVRRYGEELYWEDYWDRNQEPASDRKRPAAVPRARTAPDPPASPLKSDRVSDDDVPF